MTGLKSLRFASVRRSVLKAALASIALSMAITACALWALTEIGIYPDRGAAFLYGLGLSAIVPSLVSPPVVLIYQGAILRLEETQARLAEAVRSDFLSGLLNRHGFYEAADRAIAAARENGEPVSTIVIDVDHFKTINDTYGHDCGDKAIRHIANVIRAHAGDGAAVARIGGEEFALVASGWSKPQLHAFAEKLRNACAETPLRFDGEIIRMTVSAGTAIASHRDADPGELLKRADMQLYRAKETGRNRVANAA